jgi:hypothetical protein
MKYNDLIYFEFSSSEYINVEEASIKHDSQPELDNLN